MKYMKSYAHKLRYQGIPNDRILLSTFECQVNCTVFYQSTDGEYISYVKLITEDNKNVFRSKARIFIVSKI